MYHNYISEGCLYSVCNVSGKDVCTNKSFTNVMYIDGPYGHRLVGHFAALAEEAAAPGRRFGHHHRELLLRQIDFGHKNLNFSPFHFVIHSAADVADTVLS